MVFLLLSFSSYLLFSSYRRYPFTFAFFLLPFSDLHNEPSLTRQRLASDAER